MSFGQRSASQAIDEIVVMMNETNDTIGRGKAQQILWRALEAIWLKHPWKVYQSFAPHQLPLVVNQRLYTLPDDFGRVGPGPVVNLTRGYRFEDEWDAKTFQTIYPQAGTTFEVAGRPCRWLQQGTVGVLLQPPNPLGAIQVVSTSANDTTNVRVTVTGISTSTGQPHRASVALNGITAVNVGSPTAFWTRIDTFSKGLTSSSGAATVDSSEGQISLFDLGTVTILETLQPWETAAQHPAFIVHPKPAFADVLSIPYIRKAVKPIDNSDLLPDGWWPAIFEECCIQYRVNTGEITEASVVARPMLMDLIAYENQTSPRPKLRAFRG